VHQKLKLGVSSHVPRRLEAQNRRGAAVLIQPRVFTFTFLLPPKCAFSCTVPASSWLLFRLLLLLHSSPLHSFSFIFVEGKVWTVSFSFQAPFEVLFVWSFELFLSPPFLFAFTDIVILLTICLCFVVLEVLVCPHLFSLSSWFGDCSVIS